jgi:2',3'-cyclic-nucleotide 2'-phosphodiesterase (5'-nucleotidase family)
MIHRHFQRLAGGVAALLAACTPQPSTPAATPAPEAQAPAVPPPPPSMEVVVAATTDIHGRARGWDYYANEADTLRGLARAALVVDSLRAVHPGRVVLVDAGDILQGNPLAYVAARLDTLGVNPIIAAMNAMRYDAAAIGNHEFNYGLPFLERAIAGANFPLLAANAWRPSGTRAFPALTMLVREGARIAIVGATTPGAMVWDRDHLTGRVEIRDIVPETRRAVDSARALGADVVIVTVHSGLGEPSSYDTVASGLPSENVTARIAREVAGVDMIVFGHSHREVRDTTINGVLVVQPKNWATTLAVATLSLERHGDRWRVMARRGSSVPLAGRPESPAVLAATQRHHEGAVAYVTRAVGRTPVAWRSDSARVTDSPLIDLILEVERRVTGADLASTAAFSLEARLDSGAITVAEMARLYPYDNTLRAVRISGRQLRDYLEYSARYFGQYGTSEPAVRRDVPGYNFDIVAGADYTMDVSRPVGSRITRLLVKGRRVTDTDSFTLALNNYRQTGGGGYAMLRGAPVVYDKQEEIRQLLIDEVERRGRIRPADYFRRNWRLEPRAAIAPAMAAMFADPFERGVSQTARASGTGPAGTGRFLRIVSTNDFHGGFQPRVDSTGKRTGGVAQLATVIRGALAECRPRCETLLLDGGDLFQGTPESNLVYGRSVVPIYHALGYAAAAVGNHEFDWGQDTLKARLRDARFFLGANVRYTDGRDVEWIRDDTIVTRGPWRVGIIGIASPDTPGDSKPENVAGLRFDDPVPVIDERARSLRARGADVVVVTAHWGAFCRRGPVPSCTGDIVNVAQRLTQKVDAIVSGHTHSRVSAVVKGIPVVQALSRGYAAGVIDLPMNGTAPAEPDVREVLTDSVKADPQVDSLAKRAMALVAPIVNRPIATIAEPLRRSTGEWTLGNLVTDAQRAAGNADVAATNVSGLRADLPEGTATWGTLYQVHPFGNMLVRLTMTGDQLRAWLEKQAARGRPRIFLSGATVEYDLSRPAGQRLTSIALDGGRALAPGERYTLVMNDFMSTNVDYGPDYSIHFEPLNRSDLDALIAWTQSRPQPIRGDTTARVRVTGDSR